MLKNYHLAWLGIFFLTTSFYSCEYAKEPTPDPGWSCNSDSAATYNKDIKLVIENSCIVCHNPNGSYPSVPLTTLQEVKKAVQNNNLLLTIKHDSTVAAMPQGQLKLSQQIIDRVQCWVDNGFPQ